MKNRINAVVVLAATVIAFTAMSNAKGVQMSGHQFPTTLLADGPGPMCFPDSGCGYNRSVLANGTDFPERILLAGGPGPMCLPDTGCGYSDGVPALAVNLPKNILLADGPGPMCFPHSGCGIIAEGRQRTEG